MTYLTLLRKNLTRKKLRLALTLFSIFTAFLIFGVLKTFNDALNVGVEMAGADRLVTINKISLIQPLPYALYGKVKAVDGVETATFANWFGGYYQDPKQPIGVFAIDAESYMKVYPEMVVPEDQKQAFLNDRRGALAGEQLALMYGWKVGDVVPIQSNIFINNEGSRTWEMKIDGIYTGSSKRIDTRGLVFHYDYFNEARTAGKDTIGWLIIKTEDPELNEQVSKAIDKMSENSPYETKTSTEEAFTQEFLKQFGNIGLIVTSVVGAAFFTILLIAANTMMLAVRERTNEIAVMKTLGFSNQRIFSQIVLEAWTLVLCGALPAIGLAWLLIKVLGEAVPGLPPLALTPAILAEAFGYMLVLGLITGGLPAYNAIRIHVASALGRKI